MIFAELIAVIEEQLGSDIYKLALTTLCAVFVCYVFGSEFIRYQARIKGLTGPTGYPIIGNLWDIRFNAAEKYRQWAKAHGDVYQIQLGNIPVVVVNSAASAKEIFSHHSQALASRPEFYTFHKVCLLAILNLIYRLLISQDRSSPIQPVPQLALHHTVIR